MLSHVELACQTRRSDKANKPDLAQPRQPGRDATVLVTLAEISIMPTERPAQGGPLQRGGMIQVPCFLC
jgi:hypothetical protein